MTGDFLILIAAFLRLCAGDNCRVTVDLHTHVAVGDAIKAFSSMVTRLAGSTPTCLERNRNVLKSSMAINSSRHAAIHFSMFFIQVTSFSSRLRASAPAIAVAFRLPIPAKAVTQACSTRPGHSDVCSSAKCTLPSGRVPHFVSDRCCPKTHFSSSGSASARVQQSCPTPGYSVYFGLPPTCLIAAIMRRDSSTGTARSNRHRLDCPSAPLSSGQDC